MRDFYQKKSSKSISQNMFTINPKRMKFKGLKLTVVTATVLFVGSVSMAQDGQQLFTSKGCNACHKVGGGRLVGPDLKNVTNRRTKDWIKKFIKDSKALIDGGDSDAIAVFEEYMKVPMPAQNLSDAELDALVTYFESQADAEVEEEGAEVAEEPQDEKPEEEAQPTRSALDATKEEKQEGADLFAGIKGLKNGGPACISCHSVKTERIISGGNLAKELTNAYSMLGDAGIGAFVKSPMGGGPTAPMRAAYNGNGRDITEDEVYKITAFLAQVDVESPTAPDRNYGALFLWFGSTGLLIVLGLISMIWFVRKKKSVKHEIFKRQLKSH